MLSVSYETHFGNDRSVSSRPSWAGVRLSALLTGTALFPLTGLGNISLAIIGMKPHAPCSVKRYHAQILAMLIKNAVADLQLDAGDSTVEKSGKHVKIARFLELKHYTTRQTSPRIPQDCLCHGPSPTPAP